jgi:hypothetical protein
MANNGRDSRADEVAFQLFSSTMAKSETSPKAQVVRQILQWSQRQLRAGSGQTDFQTAVVRQHRLRLPQSQTIDQPPLFVKDSIYERLGLTGLLRGAQRVRWGFPKDLRRALAYHQVL